MDEVRTLIERIGVAILDPIVFLLFALATLYFTWGIAKFIMNVDNEEERTIGKQHMVWGVIGMFIMTMAFGIIQVIESTIASF